MPGTNLDFNIGADTSKARGELELLKVQAQSLGRELRAAMRAGDTVGAKTIAQNLGVMKAQIVGVNAALRQTEVAGVAASRGIALTARSFRSLEGAIFGISKSFGGLRGGLIGIAGAIAGREIGQTIGAVAKDLTDLQKTAGNTNLSPAQVKAYQEAMLRAGISIDDANASLNNFGKLLTDARIKAGTFGSDIRVQVMRGAEGASNGMVRLGGDTAQFIQVWRGGQPLKDLSDPLEQLVTNVGHLRDGWIGARIEAARSLQAMQKVSPERAAGLGQLVFGPNWEKEIQAIIANAATLKAAVGQVISPEDQARLDAYNKAWGDLEIAWRDLSTEAVLAFFPAVTGAINMATAQLQAAIAVWNNFSSIIKNIGAASPAFPQFGDPSIPAMPRMATGGMVRGAGSATSDSILARLSNGEFVMSAGAVQRWGAGLLAAMNGGGMPRMGRFAEGGLVTAGGTPVHLHLGGRSFTLAGSDDVVSALVSEAHWQQVRSAGVKPSWFAGRPSGR